MFLRRATRSAKALGLSGVRTFKGADGVPIEHYAGSERGALSPVGGVHIGGMRILILGGTVFVGRALTRQALARGHTVTVLNRGVSGEPVTGAELVRADRSRADAFDEIKGRSFDAVIDTSRQSVSQVRRAAAALSGDVHRYVFISTVSVYTDLGEAGIREDAPTASALENPTVEEEEDPQNYPALNITCERTVRDTYPNSYLILRPCLIVGDRDPTDRFGYWLDRLTRPGEILAPGSPQRTVQFIDVNDLATFTLHALETGVTGTFNVRGPDASVSMSDLITSCAEVTGLATPQVCWVPDDFLLEAGLQPYTDLPLWIPETDDLAGFDQISAAKAISAGLTYRPLHQTLLDALEWESTLGLGRPRGAGLSPDREDELLRRWHDQRSGNDA